jgi:hypothetical protein
MRPIIRHTGEEHVRAALQPRRTPARNALVVAATTAGARSADASLPARAFFERAPADVIILIMSFLDVYDRFCAGATSRRMRQMFQHPDVWTHVTLEGKGYVNTILRRVFRVAGPGLRHLTIRNAFLTDGTLDVINATAQRHPLPNLQTLALEGRGTSMTPADLQSVQQHATVALTAAARTFPKLTALHTNSTLFVTADTYVAGLFPCFSELRRGGLCVTTPYVRVTHWPADAADAAAVLEHFRSQRRVCRLSVEAMPDSQEHLEAFELMTSHDLLELRLCCYENNERTGPPSVPQRVLDALKCSTMSSFLSHGLDFTDVHLPALAHLRILTLSACRVDDTLFRSLPATLETLALPMCAVTAVDSLCAFLKSAPKLVFTSLTAVRMKRADLLDVLLAPAESCSLRTIDAFRIFLDNMHLGVLEVVASRGIRVRVEASMVLGRLDGASNVVVCQDIAVAQREYRLTI